MGATQITRRGLISKPIAPSYIGGTVMYQTAGVGAPVTYTPNVSTAIGDLLLVSMYEQNNANTHTPPTGWTTIIAEGTSPSGYPDLFHGVYAKIVTATELSPFVFTRSSQAYIVGMCRTYRNARLSGITVTNNAVYTDVIVGSSLAALIITPGAYPSKVVNIWYTNDNISGTSTVTWSGGSNKQASTGPYLRVGVRDSDVILGDSVSTPNAIIPYDGYAVRVTIAIPSL